jgi:hypothetical protein
MLGPEYWDALNSAVYFLCSGATAEEAFMALVDALGEGYWYRKTSDETLIWVGSPELIPAERTDRRGFVLIEDEPEVIARRLREAADRDSERPWLRQWADAVVQEPENFDLRARALVNLPDGRLLDPDGPLGCIRCEPGRWLFFGFPPLEEQDETENDEDLDWDDDEDP